MRALKVDQNDNVATAVCDIEKGSEECGVLLRENIAKGHKFATQNIKKGEPVIKYASLIGIASSDIKAGEWVHVHNCEGTRGRGDKDEELNLKEQLFKSSKATTTSNKSWQLKGYRRGDGSFGFRNFVLVVPSVHCANKVVERIARETNLKVGGISNECKAVYVTHQHGCSQLEFDAHQTALTLAGNAANPNVYGVLVVGLGCEVVQASTLCAQIKQLSPYKEAEFINIQECGGTKKSVEKGVEIATKMLQNALKVQKSSGDLSDIVLGTECGGSDSFSGLSANVALGAVSDIVVENGGSVILAETTELIGTEHILAARSTNDEVKDRVISTITGFERLVLDAKADIRGANPSPGNIKGGLSTIEEKSLGCVYKAGTTPLVSVKEYAEKITQKGVTLMNTPGNDIEQLSAMVAGGCNVCVFSTGRGTPTGSAITPTVKISSNSAVFESMREDIDINAGEIIDGKKSVKEVAEEILEFMVNLGEGKFSKAEENEQNDFAIWRLATTV